MNQSTQTPTIEINEAQVEFHLLLIISLECQSTYLFNIHMYIYPNVVYTDYEMESMVWNM